MLTRQCSSFGTTTSKIDCAHRRCSHRSSMCRTKASAGTLAPQARVAAMHSGMLLATGTEQVS